MPTITIREGVGGAIVPDCKLDEAAPGTNQDALNLRLGIEGVSEATAKITRSITHHNLLGIPFGSTITSVIMEYRCTSFNTGGEACSLLWFPEEDWEETTCTWSTLNGSDEYRDGPGGSFDTDFAVPFTIPNSTGIKQISHANLIILANKALNENGGQLRLLWKLDSEVWVSGGIFLVFRDSEIGIIADRPGLLVTYDDPPAPPSPTALTIKSAFEKKRLVRPSTCWEITRSDNTIFRFTDHDKILIVDGNTFTPVKGVQASARQKQGGLQTSNLEMSGVIASAAITHDDLRAGKFRNAKITEFLVDWKFPFLGALQRAIHYIETTTFDGQKWTANLVGRAERLNHPIGDIYGRTCRYVLGDAGCKVTLASFDDTGVSVSGVDVTNPTQVFSATSLTRPDQYFSFGNITWVTGSNAGLKMEVKSFASATDTFILSVPMPHPIEVGDTFDADTGCDKTLFQCASKFNNVDNFGGFPTIPGPDRVLQTPAAKRPTIAGK